MKFRFEVDSVSDFDTIDWSCVDEVLTQPHWAKFQQLTIMWKCDQDLVRAGSKFVDARLPLLAHRVRHVHSS